MGAVVLELDADKAPKAVTNFVELAKNGFYDNLTFHRVMQDFMIQGGDPRGDGSGGASIFGSPFEDEITDAPLVRGTIAMANRGPNSNLSQFFIVHRNDGAPWLQGKHTVFGRVVRGMDVVDKIAQVECDENHAPKSPVPFRVTVN
jgi:peptidyl-prolyl cis-trans isomerase B (cyclophilin B)